MDEPDYDPIANMDQAIRGVQDLAKIAGAFYKALVEEGFDEIQALQLTIAQLQRT